MGDKVRLLILSDIHYACDEEKQRKDFECAVITKPAIRRMVRLYRRYVWLRDPFAHNALLEQVLKPPIEPDLVVANGDYSCDSAFIGVSDPAARRSAAESLGLLRNRYDPNFFATFGDHELGKVSLAGNAGGLRLASWHAAREQLGLQPFWTHRVGAYQLIGVTSTLIALPVYEKEALPEEVPEWRELRARHMEEIRAAFAELRSSDRVILFCHDPTALPFLQEDEIRARLHQVERTIIGHLHTRLLVWQSRLLAGIPPIRGCGAAVARMSTALHQAKKWKPFRVLLCPSLAGVELFKRGGFYTATLDPSAAQPPRFQLHTVRRG